MDGDVSKAIISVSKELENNSPTREELLQRARDMVPTLIERAPKCEEMRRLPDETLEDFKKAGFFKIGLPKKYGGYEMDYDVLCEVIMEVAHGCGSTRQNYGSLSPGRSRTALAACRQSVRTNPCRPFCRLPQVPR